MRIINRKTEKNQVWRLWGSKRLLRLLKCTLDQHRGHDNGYDGKEHDRLYKFFIFSATAARSGIFVVHVGCHWFLIPTKY
jgi:hypothetical protein